MNKLILALFVLMSTSAFSQTIREQNLDFLRSFKDVEFQVSSYHPQQGNLINHRAFLILDETHNAVELIIDTTSYALTCHKYFIYCKHANGNTTGTLSVDPKKNIITFSTWTQLATTNCSPCALINKYFDFQLIE